MKILKRIDQSEVVAHFLKTEITSRRFRPAILKALRDMAIYRSIVDNPDISNEEENKQRERLLRKVRTSTFHNFPDGVQWFNVILKKRELKNIRYIDYSYWNELSKGTHLAADGAKSVREGIEVFGESNVGFVNAAEHLKKGNKFPSVILVAKDENSNLTILEGHLRTTAYLLAFEYTPEEVEAIVGFSPNIDRWI